jgi:hypothetical protein
MLLVPAEKSNARIPCTYTQNLTTLIFASGAGVNGSTLKTRRRMLPSLDPRLALEEEQDVHKARTFRCNTLRTLMEKQSMVGRQQAYENSPG